MWDPGCGLRVEVIHPPGGEPTAKINDIHIVSVDDMNRMISDLVEARAVLAEQQGLEPPETDDSTAPVLSAPSIGYSGPERDPVTSMAHVEVYPGDDPKTVNVRVSHIPVRQLRDWLPRPGWPPYSFEMHRLTGRARLIADEVFRPSLDSTDVGAEVVDHHDDQDGAELVEVGA